MNRAPRHGITIEELGGARCDTIIDVRSPAEFAADHIPGAVNCPVLDNDERARIGTIYKQVSPFEAKKIGAALLAKNVSKHIEKTFIDKPRTWKPLVYCWRGGKRSGAMAHVLREIGWEARTLEGGYKAYRRWVVGELARAPQRLRVRVVCGPTGSGKSRLLRALQEAGAQVLDLEALAAHRGSVLGDLPGRPQPSQKMFESQLLRTLLSFGPSREIFVESESRKIGQLQVPDVLIQRMRSAPCLWLEADLETRVTLLMQEYRHFLEDRAALHAQLECLVGLHGQARIAEWKSLDSHELVQRLLEEHYDPAYRRSTQRNYARLDEAEVARLDGPQETAFAALARRLLGVQAGKHAHVLHHAAP